jgi:hypothetical protein
VIVNWLELAAGFGMPSVLWAIRGFCSRGAPRVAWATLGVLAVLGFGGFTLSEVPRLWLPWMPALFLATAWGLAKTDRRAAALIACATLLGIQTLLLEATVQAVYPL